MQGSLHALERSGLLELLLHLLSLIICRRIAMQAEQSTKVELGRPQQLDFAYMDLRSSLVLTST
jgi:hypothetical protein